MLTIKNLTVHYGDFKALDIEQAIDIKPNDRIGIIGANGSGKTTLIKAILGLVKHEGTISTHLKSDDFAVHLQHNEYVETMNVKSIIANILTKEEIASDRFKELITYFNFENCLLKKYTQLSGGQKQRLTIILVLMQDRMVTFFDEVTTGLDFETRTALMEKIVSWYENKQKTVMLVTHYYEELDLLANKLLILHEGRVIDYGIKEELFAKYCGYSVIVFEDKVDDLFQEDVFIRSPKHYKAIACQSNKDELRIIEQLNALNINFKRTNYDVELLYLNALGRSDH